MAQHRRELRRRLSRDVGLRVALLDYVVNVRRRSVEPQIIERTTLEEIEHKAVADSLTGLYNRHCFEAELARESERSRRYGGSLALLLMDLDQFKQINDSHGHAIGDRVLQRVGSLVLRHVRAADVACRYGGDEFAVILPDTPVTEALVVAERILVNIEFSFGREPVAGQILRVTSSGGIAAFAPDTAEGDELFGEADGALYEAKRAGGNRIVWRTRPARPALPSELQ